MTLRLIKFLLVVGVIFALAVVGNVFIGDLSKPSAPVSETVTIDVN